eukprot:4616182-Heterocapsa_arctica.AAC.1
MWPREAELQPALNGHLRDRRDATGHIRELQAQGRRGNRELEVLGHTVAQRCKHADAAVLQLRRATALEGIHVA